MSIVRSPQSVLRAFWASEAGSGVLLMTVAALAILLANAPGDLGHLYHAFVHADVGPVLTPKLGSMTVHLWINDGFMAIFFLLVGLEIKREWMVGQLSTWDKRRLPMFAALAGMAVPALVYLFMMQDQAGLQAGWAIPTATDIAFALGVLALIGSRVPVSLKVLLMAVAIVDDMGAVAIIAVFYTHTIDGPALLAAAMLFAAMVAMNRLRMMALPFYAIGFAMLWYAMLLSGVHATIAGVLTAMTVPIRKEALKSPLHRMEHAIHPWSAYVIIPLFGFANAGVSLTDLSLAHIIAPLPFGIALGLFFGKQVGIFVAIWLSVKLGLAARPHGATWTQVYGIALLCGVGFTMSLFIGALAFVGSSALIEAAKVGTLAGSLLSALAGFSVLRFVRTTPLHVKVEGIDQDPSPQQRDQAPAPAIDRA